MVRTWFYKSSLVKKIFILLIFPLSLHAQENCTALLKDYMNAAVDVNQFSGSVLIAKSGNIIYQKTFGTLDYASQYPLDSNSLFEIGRITEEVGIYHQQPNNCYRTDVS